MASLVRPGHRASLKLLKQLAQDAQVRTAVAAGIYPRVTNEGIRLVDVKEGTNTPLGDLGLISRGTAPEHAVEMVKGAALAWESQQVSPAITSLGKPRAEAAFEASLIRAALAGGLRLTPLDNELAFAHSQWRMPIGLKSERADIFAIDLRTSELVVIELKLARGVSGHLQAIRYAEFIRERGADLVRFLERVANVMAKLCMTTPVQALRIRSVGAPILAWRTPGKDACHERVDASPFFHGSAQAKIGPSVPSDDPFRERMRFHQRWYRATRIRKQDFPSPKDTDAIGSMLTIQEWKANFHHPDAIAAVESSELSAANLDRCKRNMLSSQPLCFNLFGPLKSRRNLATSIFRELIPRLEAVSKIRIEWPGGKTQWLGDSTAFDALIEYEDDKGPGAFLGIETKLTEPFSQATYGLDHSPKYADVMRRSGLWPEPKAAQFLLTDERWNQLWRNHMLVEAVAQAGDPARQRGRLAVIRHPDHVECAQAIRGYQSLLPDRGRPVIDITLDRLLELALKCANPPEEPWLKAMKERYVDLLASERAWLAHASAG